MKEPPALNHLLGYERVDTLFVKTRARAILVSCGVKNGNNYRSTAYYARELGGDRVEIEDGSGIIVGRGDTAEQSLEELMRAIERLGRVWGNDAHVALLAAATVLDMVVESNLGKDKTTD